MHLILQHSKKWSLRILAQLGVVHNDSQNISVIPLIERIKVALAAFTTIFIVTTISTQIQDSNASLILLGSMGASAVIIFALPSSPLAKPWSFLVGHTVAATLGITMTMVLSDFVLLASATIGIVLMLMYIFECMHPPAAATALVPVIGSRNMDIGYELLMPVMLNLLVSLILNRWVLRRKPSALPERFDPVHLHNDQSPLKRLGLQQEDLMQAINSFDTVLAVSEQDLEQIYQQAQRHAYQRRSGEVLSRDIIRTM
ncbi:HPP family protein [Vibrio sp. S11_S32]|uniref:HPP family protein n=1 Tax=Vibrio sp. S11_S32 TaxID=2720225 RepID=UPI0019315734|nr:HPP family protein [Vibrio sp. S11_S32]